MKDGGPAFPTEYGETPLLRQGMTLRDWFAGQMLSALTISGAQKHQGVELTYEERAKIAYRQADAMIGSREVLDFGGSGE